MEGSCNLFVKENILHGVEDVRIEADGELADVAGTRVGIEDFVESLGVVGCRFDNLALFENKTDVIKGDALVDGRAVVLDDAFNAVFDGRAKDFTVWDVVFATTGDRADFLNREAQVSAFALDVNLVGLVHALLERSHAGYHARVVECADAEVEVFKGFAAHLGLLCHGRCWPAQDDPFGLIDAPINNGAQNFSGELGFFGRDVARFENVIGTTNRDIGVHFFHAG